MKRNKFSLSHFNLLTMDMGKLIPMTWYEALPGDTIQQATSALIRVSPLLSPVMHPVRVRIHHWFVPYRLIWEDWEDFITGGDDGDFEAAVPKIVQQTITEGSIHDYLGIPPGDYGATPTGFSALPHRAYNLIYNEFYRDQDLITELTVDKTSGEDSTNYDLVNVAWEKDYFTTARPWEQKGTEITIPLGESAPVKTDGLRGTSPQLAVVDGADEQTTMHASESPPAYVYAHPTTQTGDALYADLSQATGISVNELRMALAQQRYMEARAAFGSRYSEYLRYIVGPGFRPSDARLQEPEYLGGGRNMLNFSEVLQTQRSDEGETPLGHMGGHGISAMRSNRFRRFIPEHGLIMSMMSVVPKAIYMQAKNRKFLRVTKEMYFQKELQFTGEQTILNQEQNALHTEPTGEFGFQNRYDEYRSHPSSVSGEFHSTLNHWHYARDFTGDTALNQSFIECVPTKRVNADAGSNVLYVMGNHSIQARRILAKYPVKRTF